MMDRNSAANALGQKHEKNVDKKKWSSYTHTRLYLQLQEMNQVTSILVIDLSQ